MMRSIFNGKFFDHIKIVFQSTKFAYDIFRTFSFSSSLRNSEYSDTKKWNFPGLERIKLNTDGSFIANTNKVSFGGVIQDD